MGDPFFLTPFSETVGQGWKQSAHTGQAGKMFDIPVAQLAQECSVEMISTILLLQRQVGEAHIQVALDSSQTHTEFIRQ